MYFGPFMSCSQVKKVVLHKSLIWRIPAVKLDTNSNAVGLATRLTILDKWRVARFAGLFYNEVLVIRFLTVDVAEFSKSYFGGPPVDDTQ